MINESVNNYVVIINYNLSFTLTFPGSCWWQFSYISLNMFGHNKQFQDITSKLCWKCFTILTYYRLNNKEFNNKANNR